jgi:valyl-tRNA synthetase
MADAIYHFVWGTFCDWYVELIKPELQTPTGDVQTSYDWSRRDETRSVAAWAFDQILVMLHPLMPFITEELWDAMGERPYELIVAKWPNPDWNRDRDSEELSAAAIKLIAEIRATRTDLGVPPAAVVHFHVTRESPIGHRAAYEFQGAIKRLARISMSLVSDTSAYEESTIGQSVEEHAAQRGSAAVITDEISGRLLLEGVIDIEAEKARLTKNAAATEKERDSLAARLSNPNFTERAKPEAVEKARADHEGKAAEAERLRAALDRLG